MIILANCIQNVLTQAAQSNNESRKIKNDFRLVRHTGMEGQVEHNAVCYSVLHTESCYSLP